jgi:hypothetical protein
MYGKHVLNDINMIPKVYRQQTCLYIKKCAVFKDFLAKDKRLSKLLANIQQPFRAPERKQRRFQ